MPESQSPMAAIAEVGIGSDAKLEHAYAAAASCINNMLSNADDKAANRVARVSFICLCADASISCGPCSACSRPLPHINVAPARLNLLCNHRRKHLPGVFQEGKGALTARRYSGARRRAGPRDHQCVDRGHHVYGPVEPGSDYLFGQTELRDRFEGGRCCTLASAISSRPPPT